MAYTWNIDHYLIMKSSLQRALVASSILVVGLSVTGSALSAPAPVPAAEGKRGPAGPRGPAGEKGDRGPAGPKGATGAQGPAGLNGATGPAGPQGPAGLNGATGPAGPQGPAGSGGSGFNVYTADDSLLGAFVQYDYARMAVYVDIESAGGIVEYFTDGQVRHTGLLFYTTPGCTGTPYAQEPYVKGFVQPLGADDTDSLSSMRTFDITGPAVAAQAFASHTIDGQPSGCAEDPGSTRLYPAAIVGSTPRRIATPFAVR